MFEQLEDAVRRGGQVRGQARDHASGVDRMETVHVFARVNRFDHFLFRDVFRQGQLYEESVHVGIVVQFGDFSEQVSFADRFVEAQHRRTEAHFGAAFLLVAHVSLARSVVADQDGDQMRCAVS